MNRKVQRRLAAVGAFLALFVPSHAGAQEQKEWTWKDHDGKTRTLAELEKILAEHQLWLKSERSHGTHADLSHAELLGADLSHANLFGVNLNAAILNFANLTGASLSSADLGSALLELADLTDAELIGANLNAADLESARLTSANLRRAHLSHADLSGAHLSHAGLSSADLSGADLSADLSHAYLEGANLSDATLTIANLSGADLTGAKLLGAKLLRANLVGADLSQVQAGGAALDDADLSGAKLVGAHMTGARFVNAELKDADFDLADLRGAIFEPRSKPEIRNIARALHLEYLTYHNNPDALVQLRKQFQETGFRTQERQITYALSRRRAELDGPIEQWFQTVAFDLTCQYGMNPGRALQIWLGLLLFCWLVYAVFIHVSGASGIYQIQKTGGPAAKEEVEEQIRPRMISPRPLWRYPFRLIYEELRVFFWAGFFSLMSAFNIGFRDINFGRWLRLLPRTEYDLKAKGWARTVAGFQSLISVYLIALWVLTYFGRPFE